MHGKNCSCDDCVWGEVMENLQVCHCRGKSYRSIERAEARADYQNDRYCVCGRLWVAKRTDEGRWAAFPEGPRPKKN